MQGLAEGIHFAKKAGLDIEALIATISKGAAQSWQMENRYKTMTAGKYDFGFAVDWMRKDLSICIAEARRNGANLPVAALVDQFYAEVQKMGGGRWDTSALLARLDPLRYAMATSARSCSCRSACWRRSGTAAAEPITRVAGIAVVRNPFAGQGPRRRSFAAVRYRQSRSASSSCRKWSNSSAAPPPAYGKAAIVGVNGEPGARRRGDPSEARRADARRTSAAAKRSSGRM